MNNKGAYSDVFLVGFGDLKRDTDLNSCRNDCLIRVGVFSETFLFFFSNRLINV